MNARTSQLARTSTVILQAASDLLLGESAPAAFTMQAVADEAGVSHRTLYRHFRDRHALINAVGAMWDARLEPGPGGLRQPGELAEWTSNVARMVSFGVANREVLRKANALSVLSGVWRSDRDEHYWKLFRKRFPNLAEGEARQDFAILRHVLASASVLTIGERFALSPDDLGVGMKRAVDTLIDSVAKRDAAVAEESGSND